uniref:Cadherin 9 n=1 Tax=Anolis carolinensis TaxID=28377 RepID=A0A803T5G7_ANOCA
MMRTCYCLSFLIWTCMFHETPASPSPKRTTMYLQTERIMGLPKDHGKALHRSKRGWMWNQFFLLEEYTGPDTQYVGKAFLAQIHMEFLLMRLGFIRFRTDEGKYFLTQCITQIKEFTFSVNGDDYEHGQL